MSLSKKIILLLVLFFVFCSFFQSYSSAEDILNITIYELEPIVEILQGKCKSVPFEIYNAYNETVMVYYRIDESDMDIISSPDDYILLELGETIDGILSVCVNETLEEGTYNIDFWIEAMTKINNTGSYRKSNVKSDKQTVNVMVLDNPEITTTTSTISETTTSYIQTTSAIPVNMSISTTTLRGSGTNVENTDEPKTGNILRRDKLITIGIIIIALILIMLPYFTFIKSRKAKTEGS